MRSHKLYDVVYHTVVRYVAIKLVPVNSASWWVMYLRIVKPRSLVVICWCRHNYTLHKVRDRYIAARFTINRQAAVCATRCVAMAGALGCGVSVAQLWRGLTDRVWPLTSFVSSRCHATLTQRLLDALKTDITIEVLTCTRYAGDRRAIVLLATSTYLGIRADCNLRT